MQSNRCCIGNLKLCLNVPYRDMHLLTNIDEYNINSSPMRNCNLILPSFSACKDVGLVEVNVSKAPDSQDYCIVYTRLFKQTRYGDGDGDGDTMVARKSHSGERNIKLLLASEQGVCLYYTLN